ncbi:hypothetical protein [Agromyces salentinus]|uniref:LamG domain-containing protein n=1 Tax=Agromyces salentinus TaxID=269421 RepID=A0ABN2MHT6_9MICO|nr:hypothetical protein [Agromyces salentinus]
MTRSAGGGTGVLPAAARRADGGDAHVEWDLRRGPSGLVDLTGHGLRLLGSGAPRWRPDAIAGGAIEFDGRTEHLSIDGRRVGPLDAARAGDAVSVFALVRRDTTSTGFVAGMWQEDDDDPRRQYGLFLSLPTYGGADQVAGHVSHDGRASPGLPYSRDYSASARKVAPGSWRVVGFTYDGCRILSFLDGIADRRPRFTEVGPPTGAGLTYSKNPYVSTAGLNRGPTSDFTVGAVRLSRGMGNHLAGAVARLAVWPRALAADEVVELARAWTPASRPLIELDMYGGRAGGPAGRPLVAAGTATAWPLVELGWTEVPIRAPRSRGRMRRLHPGAVVTEGGLGVSAHARDRLVIVDSLSPTIARAIRAVTVDVRRGRGLRLAVLAGGGSGSDGGGGEWLVSRPLHAGVTRVGCTGGWFPLRASLPAASAVRPVRMSPLAGRSIQGLGIFAPAGAGPALIRGLAVWGPAPGS